MIIRIVKMTFEPDLVHKFLRTFEKNKRRIRSFDGCRKLELLCDVHQPNVLFTYSYWKSEEHLNVYRQSDLFKQVWSETKSMFADTPEAWSVERLIEMP